MISFGKLPKIPFMFLSEPLISSLYTPQTNMETHIVPFLKDCSLYRAFFLVSMLVAGSVPLKRFIFSLILPASPHEISTPTAADAAADRARQAARQAVPRLKGLGSRLWV